MYYDFDRYYCYICYGKSNIRERKQKGEVDRETLRDGPHLSPLAEFCTECQFYKFTAIYYAMEHLGCFSCGQEKAENLHRILFEEIRSKHRIANPRYYF